MKRLVVLSFTEEDFLSWDKPTQKQWMKDHPDSKFGDALKKGAGKGATLVPGLPKKAKMDPEEKAKKAAEKFAKDMESKSPEDRKHFEAALKDGIKIPPAWTKVSYHGLEPANGIVAKGIDNKGSIQVLENAEFRANRIVEKHVRIKETLEPKFDALTKTLKRQAKLDDPEAQILYIMTQMAFRIGGKVSGKAKHAAYGAASLLVKHATVDAKGVVTFDFPGKEGIRQLHTTKDPVIASIIKARSEGKEPDENLFPSSAPKVREHWQDIGGSEKPHDIRSIWATRLAKKVIEESEAPTTKKEYQELVKKASEVASTKLGNRPSQALESYIDHTIFPEVPK